MKDESFRPNRMLSYFQEEWKILFLLRFPVSSIIWDLLAGPWFRGKNEQESWLISSAAQEPSTRC